MSPSDVVSYTVLIVGLLLAVSERWKAWRAERGRKTVWQVSLYVLSFSGACYLNYLNIKARNEQLSQTRAEAETLRKQIYFLNQDVGARLKELQDVSSYIALGCIRDPKLRERALAIHPVLARPAGVELHIGVGVKAKVGHPGDTPVYPPHL